MRFQDLTSPSAEYSPTNKTSPRKTPPSPGKSTVVHYVSMEFKRKTSIFLDFVVYVDWLKHQSQRENTTFYFYISKVLYDNFMNKTKLNVQWM